MIVTHAHCEMCETHVDVGSLYEFGFLQLEDGGVPKHYCGYTCLLKAIMQIDSVEDGFQ